MQAARDVVREEDLATLAGKPSVLGSWVTPMRDAVRNKERWGKGAVRLPKILVLTCVLTGLQSLGSARSRRGLPC